MLYYFMNKYIGLILQCECEEIMKKKTKVKDEKDCWYTVLEKVSFYSPILSLIVVLCLMSCGVKDDSIINYFKVILALPLLVIGIISFYKILSKNGDYLEASYNKTAKHNQDGHLRFLRAVQLVLDRHPKEKAKKVFASIISLTSVIISVDNDYMFYLVYIGITILVYGVTIRQINQMSKKTERKLREYLICFYFILANLGIPSILIFKLLYSKPINWLCFGIIYLLIIAIIIIIFGIAYVFGPKREEQSWIENNERKLKEAEEKKKKNADFNRQNNLKKKRKKHRSNKH